MAQRLAPGTKAAHREPSPAGLGRSEKIAELVFGKTSVANDLLQERPSDIAGMHRDSRDDFACSWAQVVTMATPLMTDDKPSSPKRPVHISGRAGGQPHHQAGSG